MMKEQILTYGAEQEFLNNLSLYRFLGNKNAVNKAKIIVAEYLNLRADKKEKLLPPTIAILGEKGSGRKCLAYAISNALGHQSICQLDTSFIDSNRLEDALTYDTILVRNVESIGSFIANPVHELINKRRLVIRYMGGGDKRVLAYSGLIILTCDIFPRGAGALIKATDATICLTEQYGKNDIYAILKQRIDFYLWKFSEKSILTKIVETASNVAEAVDLLNWSKRCSVADNAEKIMMKHLDDAIGMYKANNSIPNKVS